MILTPKSWDSFQHYKDRAPQWIKLHRTLLDNFEFVSLPVGSRALAPMLWLIASEFDDGRIKGSLDALAFRVRMTRGDFADAFQPLLDAGFFTAEEENGTETADQVATLSQRIAKSHGFGVRHVSDATKREVWQRDGGKCCACGSGDNIEYDHKIPVSKGGLADAGNIQLLCRACNRRKRAKMAETAEQVDTDLLGQCSPEKEIQEENIEKRERQKETREGALSFDGNEFHVFWNVWPNRVGKPAALKALAAARKRGVPFDAIMIGVQNYIRDKPPDRPWLNPTTFLNQNRWEDQPATVAHGRIQETENLSAVARRHAEAGIAFGERPTTPSLCVIPSGPDVRLLSQGGSERPGDLRSGDGGSPERISAGGD